MSIYVSCVNSPNIRSKVKGLVTECAECASSQSTPAKLKTVSVCDTSRKVDLKYLDPEPVYSEDNMDSNIRKSMVNRWKDLGSRRNRTEQQKILTAKSMEQHIRGLPADTLPIFTDGSALENPGPCGCSAVIYQKASQWNPIVVNKPVAKRSTSFHGDVEAVNLALKFVHENPHLQFKVVFIHTNCRAAMDAS